MNFGEIKWLLEKNAVFKGNSCSSEILEPYNLLPTDEKLHGGVLSFMLDHLMAYLVNTICSDSQYVTAELELKYPYPVWPHQPVELEVRITENDPRLVKVKGYIEQEGLVRVKAVGKFMRAKK